MALTDNLVSYWKLDETSGNASDSVGSNTLTNNNTVAYNTGKINNGADGGSSNTDKCLTRDGNTPVGISYSQFATAWTLSLWVKETTQGANKVFAGMQVRSGSTQRRNLFLNSNSGVLRVNVFDGSGNTYNTSQTFNTDTWYHVILTYGGSTIKVYVNNSEVLSQARTFSAQTDTQAGGFGLLCDRQNGGSFNHFSGLVDEVGLWSRVITSNEVSELYNGGEGLSYPFTVTAQVRPPAINSTGSFMMM